jgi:hypothetical protein
VIAADDGKTRVQRHRRHRAGDHSMCRSSRCPHAGQVETAEVHDLRSAIDAEFAADPPRLELARRLVELAAGKGQPVVAAVRELSQGDGAQAAADGAGVAGVAGVAGGRHLLSGGR